MPDRKSFFGLLDKLQSIDITVNQQRCVRVRNRNATCTKCADVCTSGCISYEDNELIIQPDKCIGCGTCASACPTCALEAHNPNDAQLLRYCLGAATANDGICTIACDQVLESAQGAYDVKKVVAVPCLGRVEESLLATLAANDVKRVRLVHGNCDQCDHKTGYEMAQLVKETADKLFDVWSIPMQVELSAKFPSSTRAQAGDFDANRRGFFTSVRGEATRAAAITADTALASVTGQPEEEPEPRFVKVMEDGTLPHFIPDRRERLLDALSSFGEPADEMIDTRLWGHVIIDTEKCSSCRMCATFCPTGAISKFDEEDGAFGVDHSPGDCVKCRCCEDICLSDAITISDAVFARDLMAGVVEHYVMKPMKRSIDSPHQILDAMKTLIHGDQIYER